MNRYIIKLNKNKEKIIILLNIFSFYFNEFLNEEIKCKTNQKANNIWNTHNSITLNLKAVHFSYILFK